MFHFSQLLLAPVTISLLLKLNGHIAVWKYFNYTIEESPHHQPMISIIVPVRGLDQEAVSNFNSYCNQDYNSNFEVIFAIEDEDDPAISIISSLKPENTHCSVELVISSTTRGVGKLKNQIAAIKKSKYNLFVLVDSDVRLPNDFLRNQAADCTASDQVGLYFAVPVAVGSMNWVAALHNISVCSSMLPSVVAANRDKTTIAVGSCMVIRRKVIQEIGGLECISDKLVGLDIALSQAVNDQGYKVEMLKQPARIYHAYDSLQRYWWQKHRWLVTIRQYFPSLPLYILFLGLPFWWAVSFLVLSTINGQSPTQGITICLFVLLFDVLSAAALNTQLVKDKQLWPFIGVAAFSQVWTLPVLVHSMLSNKVLWRGRWLPLQKGRDKSIAKTT